MVVFDPQNVQVLRSKLPSFFILYHTIKARFNECYDLFKNGLSGFAWSEETKMWSAEDDVWNSLIEAKPTAEKWRTTPISNYDKLLDLFAKDRANGLNASTARERNNDWMSTPNEDLTETINGIDHLISQNEASLDNMGFMDNDYENMVSPETPSSVPSHTTSSSKGKRKRNSSTIDQDNEMIEAVRGVAEALKEGNELHKTFNNLYEKCNQKGKYEEEIFNELAAIGIEEHGIVEAFIFLTKHDHPDRMTQFLGCPFMLRKRLLEKLMSDNSGG